MQNRYILTPYFIDDFMPALESLAQANWSINKIELPDGGQQDRASAIHQPLAGLVVEAAASGERPVSIAGDCCTTIGVLAGLQRASIDPTLIWFDAHGDFNTWETTPSGFLGGMPLAMLAGLGDQSMVDAVGLRPLNADRVILTDARDLDPGEKELVENASLHHLANVLELLEYPLPDSPLYVHFDTDVLNPIDAPAMNYRTPGGPRTPELERVFRHLAQKRQIVAVSVSTWNPELDQDGRSREVCMRLLQALLD